MPHRKKGEGKDKEAEYPEPRIHRRILTPSKGSPSSPKKLHRLLTHPDLSGSDRLRDYAGPYVDQRPPHISNPATRLSVLCLTCNDGSKRTAPRPVSRLVAVPMTTSE